MRKQKIINEPVLIEIGKNQYKIDLDCKYYSKDVIPFSKIKKIFSKKDFSKNGLVIVKYLVDTPEEVLSAAKKEFDGLECKLVLREDVRLSLYNTNEVLDGREKYYYMFYIADETKPQSIHPVLKKDFIDYVKYYDDMFVPFVTEKVFKEQWLKNLNKDTNFVFYEDFVLYEENEEYKKHLIEDLKISEDKIFSC